MLRGFKWTAAALRVQRSLTVNPSPQIEVSAIAEYGFYPDVFIGPLADNCTVNFKRWTAQVGSAWTATQFMAESSQSDFAAS